MRRMLVAVTAVLALLLAAPALAEAAAASTGAVSTGAASTGAASTGADVAAASTGVAGPRADQPDIAAALHRLPGVTVVAEDRHPPAGYRLFHLRIRQPIDHRHPDAGHFEQRLTLAHRDTAAPMVLYSSGYYLDVPGEADIAEPTTIVGGNQLSVEHRFFGQSVPRPADRGTLTVWQEAADEHAITTVFTQLYPAAWLQAGVSKGGMSAIYHRRFYPGDVVGDLAYSAPDDTTDGGDAYARFLDRVGTPRCRADLRRMQIVALRHRAVMQAWLARRAAAGHQTFHDVGSLDRAFEFSVVGLPFTFWQFGDSTSCRGIPAPGASVAEVYAWLDDVVDFLAADDQQNRALLPYYYQAATQLGYPVEPQRHLLRYLHYAGDESARGYLPRSVRVPAFDPDVAADTDRWVRTHGRRLIFVYGGNDPYSATPYRPGPDCRDCRVFRLPGSSHLTAVSSFPARVRAEIGATLRRWVHDDAHAEPPPVPNRGLRPPARTGR